MNIFSATRSKKDSHIQHHAQRHRAAVFLILCCILLNLFGCNKPHSGSSSNHASSDDVSSENASSENVPSKNASSKNASSKSASPNHASSENVSSDIEEDYTVLENNEYSNYFSSDWFEDEAAEIYYLFHQPMRKSETASPLFIFLHGLGDNVSEYNWGNADPPASMLMTLENLSEEYSNYMLVPITPTPDQGWWSDEQLSTFQHLIYDIIDKYNVDAKRIYISGLSMGGFTTCRLVNEMLPDTFAAAVPLSGSSGLANPEQLHNTAFHIYHAEYDTVVGVDCARQLYNQLVWSQHPNVIYTERDIGGHMDPLFWAFRNTADLLQWMFEQRLP